MDEQQERAEFEAAQAAYDKRRSDRLRAPTEKAKALPRKRRPTPAWPKRKIPPVVWAAWIAVPVGVAALVGVYVMRENERAREQDRINLVVQENEELRAESERWDALRQDSERASRRPAGR